MTHWRIAITLIIALLPLQAARSAGSEVLSVNTKTSTVFVANFDAEGKFAGWGSGFFVDDGIVVTNKHVIEGGTYYRVFATEANDSVDLDCYRDLTRSDVKINLEDDVAYMRVFIECPHGTVFFADHDPVTGESIGVLGYPSKGTLTESLNLTYGTGSVTGTTAGAWLKTDAYLHFGNSGGPVVQGDRVVGVAVAKSVDQNGNYLSGLFVPVSVIRRGLESANDSTFGYTPQQQQKNSAYQSSESETNRKRREAANPFDPVPAGGGEIASDSDCRFSLGDGGEATGFGGCRCKEGYHQNAAATGCLTGPAPVSSSSSSAQSSSGTVVVPSSSSSSSSVQPLPLFENFPDVRENYYAAVAIQTLRTTGVLGGYPDGTFKPRRSVNRAELLKIIMEGFHAEEVRGEVNCFPDVRREWFAPYVCAGKRLGWVSGYSDGTYRPGNTVNRAEAIKILISSFASGLTHALEDLPRDVVPRAWYTPFVSEAVHRGILSSLAFFHPEEPLIRAEAAVWIYNGTMRE